MTLGANLQSGNTNGATLSLSGKATQRVNDERYTVKGSFNYEENDNVRTARNLMGAIRYDKFITDKAYLLFELILEKDKFRNINMATTIGPGIGYQLSNNISLEAGIAYHSKDVSIGEDLQWKVARLGMNYNRDITETLRFTNELGINPSLEKFGLYTLNNEADFIYKFSDKWSGKIIHTIGYDKAPSPDVENLDETLSAAATYSF